MSEYEEVIKSNEWNGNIKLDLGESECWGMNGIQMMATV